MKYECPFEQCQKCLQSPRYGNRPEACGQTYPDDDDGVEDGDEGDDDEAVRGAFVDESTEVAVAAVVDTLVILGVVFDGVDCVDDDGFTHPAYFCKKKIII